MEEEIVRSVFSVSSCDRNSGPLPRGSQSRRGLGQLHPPSCETSTREEKKTNQEKTATKTNSDKIQDLPSDLILLQPGLSWKMRMQKRTRNSAMQCGCWRCCEKELRVKQRFDAKNFESPGLDRGVGTARPGFSHCGPSQTSHQKDGVGDEWNPNDTKVERRATK